MMAHMEPRAVLVIDDNDATRNGLVQLLNLQGYRTVAAEDGRTGLDCLRRDPTIGVIILDLTMPGTDGYWFRTAQRADPAIADVPLIVFTGADDAHLEPELLIGTKLLRKPLGIPQLLDTIASHCAA